MQIEREERISHISDRRTREQVSDLFSRLANDDPHLSSACFDNIKLKDEGIIALASLLGQNNHLNELSLQNVGITEEGILILATALAENKSLKSLKLKAKHAITESALKKFNLALRQNRSLKLSLSPMDKTRISEETYTEYKSLTSSLPQSTSPFSLRDRWTSSRSLRSLSFSKRLSLRLTSSFEGIDMKKKGSKKEEEEQADDISQFPTVFRLNKNDSLLQIFDTFVSNLPESEDADQWLTHSDPRENMKDAVVSLCDQPHLLPLGLKFLKAFALSVSTTTSNLKKETTHLSTPEFPLYRTPPPTEGPSSFFSLETPIANTATTIQQENHAGLSSSAPQSTAVHPESETNHKKKSRESQHKEKKGKKTTRKKSVSQKSSSDSKTKEKGNTSYRSLIIKRVPSNLSETQTSPTMMASSTIRSTSTFSSYSLESPEASFDEMPELPKFSPICLSRKEVGKRQQTRGLTSTKKFKVDFNKVKILKLLSQGIGSIPSVYSVDVSGLQCAMKEYAIDLSSNQQKLKKILEETKNIEALQHPNIVQCLSHSVDRSCVRIFASQYESTLRKEIQQRVGDFELDLDDPFSSSEIEKVVLNLSRGLRYLHNHGIVHQDIRSNNIFVNFDGRGNLSEVALADFDSTKQILFGSGQRSPTRTLCYMAPEVLGVCAGGVEEETTTMTDIWSFGMVIYELLTLSLPYAGSDGIGITQEIQEGLLPPLPSPLSKLPLEEELSSYGSLIDLFAKCCVHEPEKRVTTDQLVEYSKKNFS